MKKLTFIKRTSERHWVGDGFPVRSIFTYNDIAEEMSPFLLMDYAGPEIFSPTEKKRGVGEHPHRGFETVTIVYEGEVEHRDSAGGGGLIGTGDVQWMTAASGIVHEEFHGRDYAKRGGAFEMVQLWVNLPRKYKMAAPAYQGILRSQIPELNLPNSSGSIRIIAGEYLGKKGPARTFSPMQIWDIRLKKDSTICLGLKAGDTCSLFLLKGKLKLISGEILREADLAVFDRNDSELSVSAIEDATILFMGGTPLGEPILGHGPFVMNTEAEIRQALLDYQSGKMGHLPNRS